MNKEVRLAMLIDAENISSKYIETILAEANGVGNVIYKRIFGNWTDTKMNAWRSVILDNAIQPIQQFNNASGKNASDSALIIEAMDLLYRGNLDGFCIVSSDSDFTRLASRLRESDKYVLGMGESKTPRSFISACDKFLYLDVLQTPAREESAVPPAAPKKSGAPAGRRPAGAKAPVEKPEETAVPGKNLDTIKKALINLTEENSDDNGWIFSGQLGSLLNRQFSDFDVRNFGYKKFVPFIESLKIFEINSIADPDSPSVKHNYFRLK